MACGCGNPECAAGVDVDKRASSVVINVVADESALKATPDPHMSGERPARPIAAGQSLVRPPDPEPDPPADGVAPLAGRLVDGGAIPTPLLAERTAMMPKRRRTRAQNRASRIATERKQNHDARMRRRQHRPSYFGPAPPPDPDDPPPF